MSKIYFGRTWELKTVRNGVTQLVFTSDDADSNRLVFDCSPFAGMGECSYLHVGLYGLSSEQIKNILVNDIIQLKVGWAQMGNGAIFYGSIQSFWGRTVIEGQDISYVFNVYALSYTVSTPGYISIKSDPASLDLSSKNIPSPITIGAQAAYIANYYGYRLNTQYSLPSYTNQTSVPLVITGDNIDDVLSDFYYKTGAAIVLDSRDNTYSVMPANPTKANYNSLVSGKVPGVTIDNNSGLVDFPVYDVMTGWVQFIRLIDTDLEFLSLFQLDVANSQLVNVKKTLVQDLIVQLRDYKNFLVYNMTYYGDTRGNPWYQNILAYGQTF